MGATAAEIRELCLRELRDCEASKDPVERRYRAGRALLLARLARIHAEKEVMESGDPEAATPPSDFLDKLDYVLSNLSDASDLDGVALPPAGGASPSEADEPPPSDAIVSIVPYKPRPR